MSVAEKVFWDLARNHRLGFEVRRQHPIGGVTVDFYCVEAKLAIEFDGEQHDPVKDEARDMALAALGIDTIRIPNREFFELDKPSQNWLEAIIRRVEERTGRNIPR